MIRFLAEVSNRFDMDILATPTNDISKIYNIYELDISDTPLVSYWTEWEGWYDNFVGSKIELYYEQFLIKVNSIEELLQTNNSMFITKAVEMIDGGDANLSDNVFVIFECGAANDYRDIECGKADDSDDIVEDISDSGNAFTTVNDIFDLRFADDIRQTSDIEYTDCLYAQEEFGTMVYFNIPKHSWLYSDTSVEGNKVIPFLSSPLNPDNPANSLLNNKNCSVRLEEPNFTIKLSDNINGITLNQGFSINLFNNDGYFDDDYDWNAFNTPVNILKSTIENPNYYDFKIIRTGLVENIRTNFDKFEITVSDKFKAMSEQVCGIIKRDLFPETMTIDDKVLGKNIPLVYGRSKVKLLKLNNTQYMAAEYISSIQQVLDKDGNSISFSYDSANNIITSGNNADSAVIVGYTNNKIGEIITDLITRKTLIKFNNSNWKLDEVNQYIQNSARINIVLSSGDIKKAIQEVLKNDMAYFIQQLDGRFTIRQWGTNYNIHTIPSWAITKKLEKTWDKAEENYFSHCVINYNYTDENNFNSYLYDEKENMAEDIYRKKLLKTFDTVLINLIDVKKLCTLLSNRFIAMKQTIKLAVGIDTSNMELLDKVEIHMKVNDRLFSQATTFIIKEINPAQDILTLEEI
jgi:hypothetical protein